jgi:hypothetical protein
MPLGLVALVAVGVHAAADAWDARLLSLVDRGMAAMDTICSRDALTQPLVGLIGLEQRTRFAAALALLWELSVDLVLAVPLLGYRERDPKDPTAVGLRLRSWVQQPTTLRWTRPPLVVAMVLAGACQVARMVGSQLHGVFEGGRFAVWASPLGRLGAMVTLGWVLLLLGWRAVGQSAVSADAASAELLGFWPRFSTGLIGALVAWPLAMAALLDAAPVLSFFR